MLHCKSLQVLCLGDVMLFRLTGVFFKWLTETKCMQIFKLITLYAPVTFHVLFMKKKTKSLAQIVSL